MTTNRHTNGCQPFDWGSERSYAADLSARIPLLALRGPGVTGKPTVELRAESGLEGPGASLAVRGYVSPNGGVQGRAPSPQPPTPICNAFDAMGHRVDDISIGRRVMPQIGQRLANTRNTKPRSRSRMAIPNIPSEVPEASPPGYDNPFATRKVGHAYHPRPVDSH